MSSQSIQTSCVFRDSQVPGQHWIVPIQSGAIRTCPIQSRKRQCSKERGDREGMVQMAGLTSSWCLLSQCPSPQPSCIMHTDPLEVLRGVRPAQPLRCPTKRGNVCTASPRRSRGASPMRLHGQDADLEPQLRKCTPDPPPDPPPPPMGGTLPIGWRFPADSRTIRPWRDRLYFGERLAQTQRGVILWSVEVTRLARDAEPFFVSFVPPRVCGVAALQRCQRSQRRETASFSFCSSLIPLLLTDASRTSLNSIPQFSPTRSHGGCCGPPSG